MPDEKSDPLMGDEVTIAIEGNDACLPHALQTRRPRPSVYPRSAKRAPPFHQLSYG
jgi:hypothetical protein